MTDEMPEGREGNESRQADPVESLAQDVASRQSTPEGAGDEETAPEVLAEVADEMGARER
jgi:hypothetical protein